MVGGVFFLEAEDVQLWQTGLMLEEIDDGGLLGRLRAMLSGLMGQLGKQTVASPWEASKPGSKKYFP